MRGILAVIFIIMIIGAVFWAVHTFTKAKKREARVNRVPAICSIATAIVSLILFIFIPFGFTQVNTGEIAVVRVYGEVTGIKNGGLHFRNIISTKYDIYDTTVQDKRSEFESYTKDGQAIRVSVVVQYQIQPEKVMSIAKEFGSLDVLSNRVDVVGTTATRNIITENDAMTLLAIRSELANRVMAEASSKFDIYYIDVINIFVDEITFTAAFEDMIEARMLAEQELLRQETQLAMQLAEAKNKVDLAEQDAKKRLAEAEGDASATLAVAEAEATKLRMLAEAEADKLRIQSIEIAKVLGINIIVNQETGKESVDSSDPNIKALSEYMQYIAYLESWDGKLPEVLVGDDVELILPTKK